MDFDLSPSFTEQTKKWLVLLSDAHEGPFATTEVQELLATGQINQNTYLWCDGMPDWSRALSIDEFRGITSLQSSSKSIRAPVRRQGANPFILAAPLTESLVNSTLVDTASLREPVKMNAPKKKRITVSALVAVSIAGLAIAYRTSYRPELPLLKDVSKDEYLELQSAARELFHEGRPSGAIAISKSDPSMPVFYVSSNLKRGARLRISIDGVPETLVGTTHVTMQALVNVQSDGLAKSAPVASDEGHPLPTGEYRIRLTCVDCENTALVLAQKRYFFGRADSDYRASLREYHDRLIGEAQSEVSEIRQITETLEHQLRETTIRFDALAISEERVSVKKKKWAAFSREWSALESQIDALFASWSKESLQAQYYGASYVALKDLGTAISRLHERQGELFLVKEKGEADKREIIVQQSKAESILTSIQSRLTAMSRPPSSDGLPAHPDL